MPGVQSFSPGPGPFASPIFWKSTALITRDVLPSLARKFMWFHAMPESSTAIATPVPSRPLHVMPALARTPFAPVACSIMLNVRVVMRFGEMLCTSLRAAIVDTALAGSRTDSARTDR